MKKYFQFFVLVLAIYGAYCFYDNHLRTFIGVEEKTEETVTKSEKKEKVKSSKRKSKNKGSKQEKAQTTEQAESKVTNLSDTPKSNANNDEFEEEVEEAEFIPKTR